MEIHDRRPRHGCCPARASMDDRPRPQRTDRAVRYLAPTRAELLRFFAWGYLSRRELNERLRHTTPLSRRTHEPNVPTAA